MFVTQPAATALVCGGAQSHIDHHHCCAVAPLRERTSHHNFCFAQCLRICCAPLKTFCTVEWLYTTWGSVEEITYRQRRRISLVCVIDNLAEISREPYGYNIWGIRWWGGPLCRYSFCFRWSELMRFYVKTAHAAKRTPNYVELNMIFRKQTNGLPFVMRHRKYAATMVVVQCATDYKESIFLINIYIHNFRSICLHLPRSIKVFPASRTKNMLYHKNTCNTP